MSDTVKAWIEDRRTARVSNSTLSVSDAHNNLPRALDALNAVLEEHKPMPNSSSALFPTPACTCGENYPCPTVQAIEGAISE